MSVSRKQSPLHASWKFWGVAFGLPPCPGPVDLERLVVDTAIHVGEDARLFVMAVTWLTKYQDLVDREKLVHLAEELRGRDSARLGLFLETAQQFIGDKVFQAAIDPCRPWAPPEPLFDVDRTLPGLSRLAKQSASPTSRRWGLWAQAIDRLKPEALHTASWIAQHNPSFALRTLLKGDVRSKVLAALVEQGLTDLTETDLTRLAGCTRRAMHLALANLESAGLIVRRRVGRRYAINLARLGLWTAG